MKKDIEETLDIPEGVQVSFQNGTVNVKGSKGELNRYFDDPWLDITAEGNVLKAMVKKATKREKTKLYTYLRHINNMMKGVLKPMRYKLKVCSGHFPMNVSMSGTTFSIKNFLGEKVPRTLKIKEGVTVKLDGDIVQVESIDIELAGQVAGQLERLTRITNRDLRIFQDGIYITEKPQKK